MYRIAYATGSRAEYGIVKRYLKKLSKEDKLTLEVLVTGTHLDDRYGHTVDEIVSDGFNITFEAPLNLNTSNNQFILKSMSIAMDKFGEFFQNNKYDLLIILGDRYEMISVAIAAAMHNIPILHLHGGEKTLGNYDEFIRHSITKMSLYHFTSTQDYKNRVIQLGEEPNRVFNLGALGADNAINNIDESFVNSLKKPYFVILFHPETLTEISPIIQTNQLLSALDEFKDDFHMVFIGGNADTHADEISQRVQEYVRDNNATYIDNVENKIFQNIVHRAEVYIGNSSSGIIEAPSLGTSSVNIGDRQKGRIQASSTFNASWDTQDIVDQIRKASEFNIGNKKIDNPYYQENTLNSYVNQTISILQNPSITPKDFYDFKLPFSKGDSDDN